MATGAALRDTTTMTMADAIFGAGVTGASCSGHAWSVAVYLNGQVVPLTGWAAGFRESNRAANHVGGRTGVQTKSLFNTIAGAATDDAGGLDVDFILPGNDVLTRRVMLPAQHPQYHNSACQAVAKLRVDGGRWVIRAMRGPEARVLMASAKVA